MVGAVTDLVKRPTQAIDTARAAIADARATVGKVAGVAGGPSRPAWRPSPGLRRTRR
jgi:hypothetical protein